MIKHHADSLKKKRADGLQKELDARDYRVIKAIREKFKDEIEEMYPGETEWYDNMVSKINQVRGSD